MRIERGRGPAIMARRGFLIGVAAVAISAAAPAAGVAKTLHATPAKGLQLTLDHAGPGDTVIVGAGDYHEQQVTITDSRLRLIARPGAALEGDDAHASGLALAPGVVRVLVRGLTVRGYIWGIDIDAAHRVHLDRVHLRGNETGLQLTGNSSDGAVSNLRVTRSSSTRNTILGMDCTPGPCNWTRIEHSRFTGNGAGNNSGADGVGFEAGSIHIRVSHSLASGNAGDGFDFKARDARVSSSISRDNGRDGIKLWRGGSITNSISAGNGRAGLVLEPPIDSTRYEFRVLNSAFVDNGFAQNDYGAYSGIDGGKVSLLLRNDIFALNNGPIALLNDVILREDHCLFYTPHDDHEIEFGGESFTRAEIASGIWGAASGSSGDVVGRPRFRSLAHRNLHLRAGSPGIGDGAKAGAPHRDLDGRRRPRGAHVDIGPYER